MLAGCLTRLVVQHPHQLGQPLASARRHRHDGRARKRRRSEQCANVLSDERRPFRVDKVGLGQGDDAAVDAEQLDDGEVLPGLGHDAIIGRDAQEHDVDTGGAGDHLPDEPFVARHVDDAHRTATRQLEACEPELDGDTPVFLLLETVGVGPGERRDE